MGKTANFITGIFLLFVLSACSTKDESVSEIKPADTMDIELTAIQVLQEAEKAFEFLDSLSVNLTIEQLISEQNEQKDIKLSSVLNTDVMTNPLSFHQKSEMRMEGGEIPYLTEAYFTEQGMFVYDSRNRLWTKHPASSAEKALSAAAGKLNPAAELNKASHYEGNFELKEGEEEYVVMLKATDSNQGMQEFAKSTLPSDLRDNKELLANLSIKDLDYEIALNKKTFYPSRLNVKIEMEWSSNSKPVKLIQELDGVYTNFNSLTEISVPDTVLEQTR
ncbi:DUF6612 family protein [Bacillus sp. EB01]|uniref:DUF6612 family protein n=1 Tax=Bacillus sp. EB01 TaxID=1347086 RepID=UPI0005C4F563|nr:DUF6612 family protein [Bacillus sp. EB01]